MEVQTERRRGRGAVGERGRGEEGENRRRAEGESGRAGDGERERGRDGETETNRVIYCQGDDSAYEVPQPARVSREGGEPFRIVRRRQERAKTGNSQGFVKSARRNRVTKQLARVVISLLGQISLELLYFCMFWQRVRWRSSGELSFKQRPKTNESGTRCTYM
jgi:hypothetical protein